MVAKIRKPKRLAKRVHIGAPDPSLTAVAGLVAVRELTDRLGVIDALDAAVGPVKTRARDAAPGLCLSGSRRRSWPLRISWSGWTADVPTPRDRH